MTGETVDWILVRNRISVLGSRNARQVHTTLDAIATRFGCRVADGIAERVIFRSLFPSGMTVFDPLRGRRRRRVGFPCRARQEYRNLVASLNLPIRAHEPMRLSA